VSRIIKSKKAKIDLTESIPNHDNSFVFSDVEEKIGETNRGYIRGSRADSKQVNIGHKIPIGVPLFSEEDIEATKFKINDSSILRLLTKWS
jgi:hypothetical protein